MYWATGGTILISASVLFCGLSDKIVKENKVQYVDIRPLNRIAHLHLRYNKGRGNGCKKPPHRAVLFRLFRGERRCHFDHYLFVFVGSKVRNQPW